jgi:hypothetical protein
VTRLTPGGLAERSGLIRLGDTLVAISGASGRPRVRFSPNTARQFHIQELRVECAHDHTNHFASLASLRSQSQRTFTSKSCGLNARMITRTILRRLPLSAANHKGRPARAERNGPMGH